MAAAARRVILKPASLTDSQAAELAEALAGAVADQQKLSDRSPCVLRLSGALQEDDRAYWIEHEPATPLDVAGLFDSDAPPLPIERLLDLTACLTDALQVAHGAEPTRGGIHGGVCPAVILQGTDGILKLSDFGIAPAVARVLGREGYLQLAVASGGAGHEASATWEVLAPDVVDRDDRICGFIDPEKHGSGAYRSFEAGSDVFAVGTVLYLFANHCHPYFHRDSDALRQVETAEYMAMFTPNRAFHQQLRESDHPQVGLWCELVCGMIERLPGHRPSAAEIADRLAQAGINVPRAKRVQPPRAERPKPPGPRPPRPRKPAEAKPARRPPPPRPPKTVEAKPAPKPPPAKAPPEAAPEPVADTSRPHVAARFAGRQAPLERLGLTFDEPQGPRRLLLFGMPEVRMGRSRKGNDLVLRLLPRNAEHDRLTLRLSGSQPQAIVILKPNGLFVVDPGSKNGTDLNEQRIEGRAALPLDRASRLHLARALELEAQPIVPLSSDSALPADHYAALAEPDDFWRWADDLGLGALLLRRVENLATEEQYLFVYRWADFGVEDDGQLQPVMGEKGTCHLRVLRLGRQFWLVPISDDPTLLVDGEPLIPGEVCPLLPGLKLQCGPWTGEAIRFQQHGL